VFAGLFVPGLSPFATDDLVCELGAGPGERSDIGAGDQRAPKILRLDETTYEVTDITPNDPLLDTTIGLFGAASYKGVVLMTGPDLGPDGIDGVNVFALDEEDGTLLGSATIPDYAAFTDGVVVNDALYLAASSVDHRAGRVLRWTGDAFDPIRFEVVGDLDAPPSDLIEHEGRLVVSEHMALVPEGDLGAMPAILISPKIGPDGLQADTAWQRIFQMDDYEPDPVIARAMSFGSLASFRGRLYLTTAQSPAAATLAAFDAYGRPDTWWGRIMVHAHARRALSLLVIDEAGTDRQDVTLLYGDEQVATFDPATGEIVGRPNNLGQAPRFGDAGIGSPFNQYAKMRATDDRLFLATFDFSTIAPALLDPLMSQPPLLDLPDDVVDVLQPITESANEMFGGADLYRMDTPYAPLVAEDLSGLGNASNYGVDVLLPMEDELLIGTSNPFNLRVGTDNPGGYELLQLTEAYAE
jgi:hypothetical protein